MRPLGWILIALMLSAKAAYPLEVRRLGITYERVQDGNHVPELSGFAASENLSLGLDLDLYGPLFWNSRVHSTTDPGQFRLVGLEFEIGARVLPSLSLYLHHHSQHLLDYQAPEHFPLLNAFGAEWNLLESETKPKSLFR